MEWQRNWNQWAEFSAVLFLPILHIVKLYINVLVFVYSIYCFRYVG